MCAIPDHEHISLISITHDVLRLQAPLLCGTPDQSWTFGTTCVWIPLIMEHVDEVLSVA